MSEILTKAFSYVFTIFLAYFLKRIGFLKKEDYKVLFRLMVNVTIPAVVINSFASLTLTPSLLILIGFAILCNLILIGAGYLLTKRKNTEKKALYMLNLSGYNIGGFSLPFVQAFLNTPAAVVACMLFDFGNSIMCTGANLCLVSSLLKSRQKISDVLKDLVRKLLHSAPFMSALIMILIRAVHISLPAVVTSTATAIGSANGFLAMFSIGLMFDIKWEKNYFKSAFSLLALRYVFAGAAAAVFYFCLPFPLLIRQVLVLVIFAPMSSLSPVYTEYCKGDGALSSFMLSLSIPLSMLCLVGAMMII
ncbi:AEC family transporter [Anaerolentibacter hominis]|uniref:AEC family transporter n=1 Tax=Anaerolentibacter hominis TaxID=3079009 RepID=UPI0031B8706F